MQTQAWVAAELLLLLDKGICDYSLVYFCLTEFSTLA